MNPHMGRVMRISQIIALAAVVLAGLLAGTAWYTTRHQAPVLLTSGKALIGGPFELIDQNGKPFRDTDLRGTYALFVFGYTFCPDICPTEMQVVTAALETLGPQAKTIKPIFVTIDPARDTVAVIKDYISHFHPRFTGLTGSADQIARITKAYRVHYARAAQSTGEETDKDKNEDQNQAAGDADYLMDHSTIIYLMGPDGEFLKHFTYTTDSGKLADALKKAISQ